MAVFGPFYAPNGALLSGNTLDTVFNYFFALLMILMLVISCVCNPLVFWFHRRVKQTLSAILFQILTINDFLTCLLVAPSTLYFLVFQVRLLNTFKSNVQQLVSTKFGLDLLVFFK